MNVGSVPSMRKAEAVRPALGTTNPPPPLLIAPSITSGSKAPNRQLVFQQIGTVGTEIKGKLYTSTSMQGTAAVLICDETLSALFFQYSLVKDFVCFDFPQQLFFYNALAT